MKRLQPCVLLPCTASALLLDSPGSWGRLDLRENVRFLGSLTLVDGVVLSSDGTGRGGSLVSSGRIASSIRDPLYSVPLGFAAVSKQREGPQQRVDSKNLFPVVAAAQVVETDVGFAFVV